MSSDLSVARYDKLLESTILHPRVKEFGSLLVDKDAKYLPTFGEGLEVLHAAGNLTLMPWDAAERRVYTDADVVDRLAKPSGHTDGNIFDGRISDSGILSQQGIWRSFWGKDLRLSRKRPRVQIENLIASRKAYEGPVYMQGYNPTCYSWAMVHAMLASGNSPSVGLVRDLLNDALPGSDGYEGLTWDRVQEIVDDNPQSNVDFKIRKFLSSFDTTHQKMAELIKNTVDDDGSVLMCVKTFHAGGETDSHEICIPGYNIDKDGHMDVQVIDSAWGVGALTLEGLTREILVNRYQPLSIVKRIDN